MDYFYASSIFETTKQKFSNAQKNVVEAGDIYVALKKLDKSVTLSVYNKGENIDSSEKDNIWISFYKLESNSGFNKTGTGLGLTIVKAIVELHNGKVWSRESTG